MELLLFFFSSNFSELISANLRELVRLRDYHVVISCKIANHDMMYAFRCNNSF